MLVGKQLRFLLRFALIAQPEPKPLVKFIPGGVSTQTVEDPTMPGRLDRDYCLPTLTDTPTVMPWKKAVEYVLDDLKGSRIATVEEGRRFASDRLPLVVENWVSKVEIKVPLVNPKITDEETGKFGIDLQIAATESEQPYPVKEHDKQTDRFGFVLYCAYPADPPTTPDETTTTTTPKSVAADDSRELPTTTTTTTEAPKLWHPYLILEEYKENDTGCTWNECLEYVITVKHGRFAHTEEGHDLGPISTLSLAPLPTTLSLLITLSLT